MTQGGENQHICCWASLAELKLIELYMGASLEMAGHLTITVGVETVWPLLGSQDRALQVSRVICGKGP